MKTGNYAPELCFRPRVLGRLLRDRGAMRAKFPPGELDRLQRDVYMSGRLDKWRSDGELDPGSSKRRAPLLPDSAVLARADPRRRAGGRRSHALRARDRNAAW